MRSFAQELLHAVKEPCAGCCALEPRALPTAAWHKQSPEQCAYAPDQKQTQAARSAC